MSGRVYASILHKASSYGLTLPFAAPFKVCTVTNLSLFVVCIEIGSSHSNDDTSPFFAKQHTWLVAVPSCQLQLAHHYPFSSWGSSRSDPQGFSSEVRGRKCPSRRRLSTYHDVDFQHSQVRINNILRSNEQVIYMSVFAF